MRKICLLIVVLLLQNMNVFSQTIKSKRGDIKDLVLIYNGGAHREKVFDEELFDYYVSMPNEEGGRDWLFDGFLFLELKDGKGHDFASYYGEAPARKLEWTNQLEFLFTKGQGVCALESSIEKAKPEVKGKFKKRKAVIFMPEPIPNQKNWGALAGDSLDFSKQEDRIKACKWYIDTALKMFKQAKFKNVEITGFYWLAEEATNSRDLTGAVSSYLKGLKKSFVWIPYFKSDGYNEWKELGFTQAFLQPNHFFNDKIPYERLPETFKLASENGMSVEMEFDDRALHSYGWSYRLEDYIKAFKESGAFKNLDMAYYQGNNTFFRLAVSDDPKDRALFLELAKLIAYRQKQK